MAAPADCCPSHVWPREHVLRNGAKAVQDTIHSRWTGPGRRLVYKLPCIGGQAHIILTKALPSLVTGENLRMFAALILVSAQHPPAVVRFTRLLGRILVQPFQVYDVALANFSEDIKYQSLAQLSESLKSPRITDVKFKMTTNMVS